VVAEVLKVSEEEVQATLREEGLPKFNSTGVMLYAKLNGQRPSDVKRAIVRAYRNGVGLAALVGRYHTSGGAIRDILEGANVELRGRGRPSTKRRVTRAVFEERSLTSLRAKTQICAACRRLQRRSR
jgi:hypothetical protein